MKRKISIISAILAVFSSCQVLDSPQIGQEEDGKVTLDMSVLASEVSTKSGADDPLSSICALVFDENGYLVEHAYATSLSGGQGDARDETTFSLSLTGTSEFRRIHLIANYSPASIPFGSESQLIGTMTTSSSNFAFWQYVDLDDGIIEGREYPELQRIPLVRNCAVVNVVVNDPTFTLKGYKVVNIPREGSIAPWVNGVGPATCYNSTSAPTYASINSAGYHGYVPPGNDVLTSTEWRTALTYVYEHPYTGSASTYTYILLWGRLSDMEADSYYKMDIVSKSGSATEYMDILRNFRYTLRVEAIGSTGYTSEEEAASHPAGNNVSGSVDTESLDNISDGNGQFFVSATELVIVDGDNVELKYKFVPDAMNAATVVNNALVTVDAPAGDVLRAASAVSAADDSDGWRTVTLYPRTPDGITYSQTIRLTTTTGLQKTVKLRLRPKFDFVVSCTPSQVEREIGEKLSVNVTLPDGLPESVFPLRLVFSSVKNSINPDSELNRLPVETGNGTFGFAKDVYWSDYNDSHLVTAYFTTNCTASATDINVLNKYFNTGTCSFTNADRYVTSFTIRAYSLVITNLSTSRSYYSIYMYYDSSRTNRINSTTYRFYNYGPNSNTTVTVNRMKSTDMIYFYSTSKSTTVGLTIEELEEGGHSLTF